MSITKKEKLELLLKQIELPESVQKMYFNDAILDKLEIYRNEGKWVFHITLHERLPAEIYQLFAMKITNAFSAIAKVSWQMNVQDYIEKDDEWHGYWEIFVSELKMESPKFMSLTKAAYLDDDNNIMLTVGNAIEAETFSKELQGKYQSFCQKVGLHPKKITINIEEQHEEIQKFEQMKKEEDHQKVQEAFKQMEKLQKEGVNTQEPLQIGYPIKEEPIEMQMITEEERSIVFQGYVFDAEIRELRSGRQLLIFKITDYTDSFLIKIFSKGEQDEEKFSQLKKGMWVKVKGTIQTDNFSNELTMMARDIQEVPSTFREDIGADGEKRVELHTHTLMSQMDSVVSASKLIEQAVAWGHKAIAITDHAVAQAFPEAYSAAKKHGIKVIYGVEINLVDDGVPIAYNEIDRSLKDATYVVFDVETTGLSAIYDTIIELAAVKIKDGEIIDRFESFANPHHPLSETTINLTGITDDMVENAPEVEEVLRDFHEWMADDILVAHNAEFDMGFINTGFKKIGLSEAKNPVIDTLELARFLLPELKNHRLNTLCKRLDIELTQHHRAIYDAEATGYLLWKLMNMAYERGINNHVELNEHAGEKNAYQRSRPYHATLLAVNDIGIKNIYKLISMSHIDYFYRVPRVPRSKLKQYREGILVGTACDKGEVFETMMQKSKEQAEEKARFYDYIEVQPPENYVHLMDRELVQNEAQLYEIIRNLVELADKLGKPCVATGNVHHLERTDIIYRKILINSQNANPLSRQTLPNTFFHTTNDMLEKFHFLGKEKAREIVIANTNQLADQIEEVKPVKEDLYTPTIDGAEQEIRDLSYQFAQSVYGEELPQLVEERMEKELKSIIGHGFAVIYLISQKLVKKSLDDGYLVGSRGSVGSSLIATFTEITEVNPLPPHYVCPNCKHSEFFNDGSVGSGFDLPDKDCPKCQTAYKKDGQDIPFETFLGFKGDKVPDIDLNFSGEYQPRAHNYTKVLFGEDKVFRAGTIGTVAEKTAYGYVKGYAGDNNLTLKQAEVDRLVQGCTGAKRTTGQHPGGIIVVPEDKEIYDFTPIQYPADDRNSEWLTTHFDFHSIDENLLKLDILGHDDPTVIRMLQDLSGIDPQTIPTDDEEVMKIFSSPEVLGVTSEQIMCKTGTLGVPEFGTRFVRQMLEDTKPKTFAELVIISGLSHGTDVWLGNAQELINDGICKLPDVIGCRDDIMVYLMHQGLEASLAFKIMESVRKGKGLQPEWEEEMKKNGVPNWYIESCKKIKYMFPKAHAAAYVLMAIRIAYFKVHHPIFFYAAYFSVRADDFELDTMVKGSDAIRNRIKEINEKGNDASPKEKNLLTVLELSLEMNERGFKFQKVDLYRSSATDFIVDGDSLIPPFNAIDGLGTNAALNIVKAREEGEFLSKQDLRERSRISKTVLEYLDGHGSLEGMEEENQLSLF
ncbi:DNA polymerase-3 subunit alpha (Gram-positive type) [Gracilibacillus halotolerans]|uniref:DNA polymerase III PolC-type n=1 Tax=Gracilibacillus halotolerans TaxID=74386 RepID=A0A841RJV5_9BACI|nr:PolC-type DNA polymerase III [Gracilibacillus halotolerans]MBB6511475.1 DNA polymerase-3 subunit alpha (Gram-positive type) [Gracilibacillus halotolerans]